MKDVDSDRSPWAAFSSSFASLSKDTPLPEILQLSSGRSKSLNIENNPGSEGGKVEGGPKGFELSGDKFND